MPVIAVISPASEAIVEASMLVHPFHFDCQMKLTMTTNFPKFRKTATTADIANSHQCWRPVSGRNLQPIKSTGLMQRPRIMTTKPEASVEDKGRLNLRLSDEAMVSLAEIKAKSPKTKAQQLSAAFDIARWIVEVESRTDPIILVLGNIEITNVPFRLERELKFREAISKLSVTDKSILEEIYESTQLKPSFLGFGVDLKPLLRLAAKLFKKPSRD